MVWSKNTDNAYYLIDGQIVKGPYSITDAKNYLSDGDLFETSKFMGKICFDESTFGIWVPCKTSPTLAFGSMTLCAYWIRVENAKEAFHKRRVSIISSLEEYQEIAKQLPTLKTLLLLEGIEFSGAI